ncbi:MAG: diguanylate cyclase, partial [Novosphingobium sp.]|nr:diguanylate cyclase [Novosphingobium sp.]
MACALRSCSIDKLRDFLALMKGSGSVDDRARSLLVETLYTQPASLAIGAANGIISSVIAAWISGNRAIAIIAAILTAVAVARIAFSVRQARMHPLEYSRRLEILYELGAFTYAALIGLVAALCIWFHVDGQVQVMTVAVALCYGTGIAARNAGRPIIAIGQLFLAQVPVIIALLSIGSLTYIFLAITVALLLPAMTSISLNVFKVLRKSIIAAETSARLADKMQALARTDVVTGLANRAGLNHQLVEKQMALCDPHKLALFWLDLDRFKEVNDTLGHPVGDRVLAEVAVRLRDQAPPGATIARFGGDEFIIVCELPTRFESERLAGAILEDLGRPFRVTGERLEVGCSMGIALMPDDGADIDRLMQAADLALYHAKINGRNQASFFDPSMTRDLVRRKEIEAELRNALQQDELSIFFQPIVDLETGRIRTFEALVRWFHPIKGEMRPDEFIPVAEETGVIITLGNWIATQAARACAQWPEDVTVAVNLSPLQIKAPGAALGILNALKEANLDPRRLELEVTESLFLEDNDNTGRFIEELSAKGIRFALDDFG